MKVPDFLNANRHGYARKGNESLDAGYGQTLNGLAINLKQ